MSELRNVLGVQHSDYLQMRRPASAAELAGIRHEARRFLASLKLSDEAREDLVLAVDAAATNSILHAYALVPDPGTVELTFWTEARAVCIEVVDHGRWRTPTPSYGCPGRGLGIPIMERLVDSVAIHYDARGTRVLLRHGLPGTERALPYGGDRITPLGLGLHLRSVVADPGDDADGCPRLR